MFSKNKWIISLLAVVLCSATACSPEKQPNVKQSARQALQKACLSETNPDACYELKESYIEESMLVGDEAQYIELLGAYEQAKGEEKEKLKQQVVSMSEKLCAKDHALACFYLGGMLKEEKKPVSARQYFQKSCDLGIGSACFEIASGLQASKKYQKIFQNYEKACNYGYEVSGIDHPCAHAFYAYQCGAGVEKNPAKAKEYFTRACERGSWDFWGIDKNKCKEDYKKMTAQLDNKACKEMFEDSAEKAKRILSELEEYIQKGDILLSSVELGSIAEFVKTKTYKSLSKNEKDIIDQIRDMNKALKLDGDFKKVQKFTETLCQMTGDGAMCGLAGMFLLPEMDFEIMPGTAEIKTTPKADAKKAVTMLHKACEKGVNYYCYTLSEIYEDGKYGIEKNPAKAEEYEKMIEALDKSEEDKKTEDKPKN